MTDFRIHALSGEGGEREDIAQLTKEVQAVTEAFKELVKKTNGNGKKGGVMVPPSLAIALTMFVLGLLVSVGALIFKHDSSIETLGRESMPRIEALEMRGNLRDEMQRMRDGCPTAIAERRIQTLEGRHDIVVPPCVRN